MNFYAKKKQTKQNIVFWTFSEYEICNRRNMGTQHSNYEIQTTN